MTRRGRAWSRGRADRLAGRRGTGRARPRRALAGAGQRRPRTRAAPRARPAPTRRRGWRATTSARTAGSLVVRRLPKGPRPRGRLARLPLRDLRVPAARLRERRAALPGDLPAARRRRATRATGSARATPSRSSTTPTRRTPRSAAIVVTPDGTSDASWFDRLDGSTRNQEYVLDHVIPFVDRHYRTITDRRGRAIAGLSNGGHGTLLPRRDARRTSSRRREGCPSNVGWQSFTGGAELNSSDSPAWFNGHLPIHLAGNLDGLDLVLDIGASCDERRHARTSAATFAFEQVFLQDNRDFVAELRRRAPRRRPRLPRDRGRARLALVVEVAARARPAVPAAAPGRTRSRRSGRGAARRRGCRSATGRCWTRSRSTATTSPSPARRASSSSFATWTRGGLTVQGSGAADVVTAPLYRAGSAIPGDGGGRRSATGERRRRRPSARCGWIWARRTSSSSSATSSRSASARGGYWTVAPGRHRAP